MPRADFPLKNLPSVFLGNIPSQFLYPTATKVASDVFLNFKDNILISVIYLHIIMSYKKVNVFKYIAIIAFRKAAARKFCIFQGGLRF